MITSHLQSLGEILFPIYLIYMVGNSIHISSSANKKLIEIDRKSDPPASHGHLQGVSSTHTGELGPSMYLFCR